MDREFKLPEQSVSQRISVRVPASAVFNLDKFQEIQKDVLRRLGCGACTSGHDIRWLLEQKFFVDEQLNLHAERHLG